MWHFRVNGADKVNYWRKGFELVLAIAASRVRLRVGKGVIVGPTCADMNAIGVASVGIRCRAGNLCERFLVRVCVRVWGAPPEKETVYDGAVSGVCVPAVWSG